MWSKESLFIGGKWVAPATSRVIDVASPSTEEVVGRVPEASAADVDRAVLAARAAFDTGPWPRMTPAERADVLVRVADGLAARADELTQLITSSSGLPITVTQLAHVMMPQFYVRHYADLARTTPLEEYRAGLTGKLHIRQAPVGVVGAIIPWNIPLLATAAKLGAAWAAGCTAVLKPSPETPLDAFVLAEICEAAGMPPGVLNLVPGGAEAGTALVAHPGVDKITFTGSTTTGRAIAEACGRTLTGYALELGGNAAAIVLDDAPIGDVAAGLVQSALAANNGQACIAQSRVLVPRSRAAELTDALAAAAREIRVGDPFDPATMVGPLITSRHRERVSDMVAAGRAEGATVCAGGGVPAGLERGWYFEPTVLAGVDNGMRVAREEIFGPVVTVIEVRDEDEAVAIANDTEYGLSGSVWSADLERAAAVGRRIAAGQIWLNDSFTLDPACPFGGWKNSGNGREGGPECLHEYLQTQTTFRPAERPQS
ncbi:aldehyde dehydrogenase [Streptomyces fuscichromogenes]|uniref:aldehyde dehydrogenase (NAD(+)) n=1 Tax=Streptomyces fuscichromogenes TaxID=1324013 RepID=A0A917XGK3_9ACTN|nr:aldehyde dehydrogenase [Streptomyces fuscichromogenes]GGN20003.1 putative aldehyde dehydrogenase [Streptomyces fuscichromogenes]